MHAHMQLVADNAALRPINYPAQLNSAKKVVEAAKGLVSFNALFQQRTSINEVEHKIMVCGYELVRGLSAMIVL
jgi:hypothetical protein